MTSSESQRPPERHADESGGADAKSQAPLLTVVRGAPTPEQLAALIAVVSSRASGDGDEQPPVRSPWAAPVLRTPLSPAPGAWRASALPR